MMLYVYILPLAVIPSGYLIGIFAIRHKQLRDAPLIKYIRWAHVQFVCHKVRHVRI